MAEFIKSNFNKRSFFDKKFLEEMRQVALLGRKNTYIDSITSEFITFKDINTCATYDEENIRIYIFNKFLHCLLYTKKYKIKFLMFLKYLIMFLFFMKLCIHIN